MKKIFPLVCISFLLMCRIFDSKYDPTSPGWVDPSFTVDSTLSTLHDGDTIVDSTHQLVLVGNESGNQFRWKIDNTEWTSWAGAGQPDVRISLSNIDTGLHIIKIQTCYHPSGSSSESSISFYSASPPFVIGMSDTIVKIEVQSACTLWVSAGGTGDISYQWYFDTIEVTDAKNDTLMFDSLSMNNSGIWYCKMTSKYGTVTSDTFSVLVSKAATYKVIYNCNVIENCAVPVDSTKYRNGQSVMVMSSKILNRDGYSFAGWNKQADGQGAQYAGGQTLIIENSDVILYAKWTQNPVYRVVYRKNGSTGGTVPIDSNNYENGMVAMVYGNTGVLSLPEYTFLGWKTDSSGTGVLYVAGDELPVKNNNITLYAQWTKDKTFKLVYHSNGKTGGEEPVDNNNYRTGTVAIIYGNTKNLIKLGYTFLGWSRDSTGKDTIFFAGATVKIESADINLYAIWTMEPTVTIVYKGNGNTGGTVPVDPSNYTHNSIAVVNSNTKNLVKTGYTFQCWNSDSTGNGTDFYPDSQLNVDSSDIVLYAKWKPLPVSKVLYKGNGSTGGEVPQDSVLHMQGTVVIVKNIGTMSRQECLFTGWCRDSSGNGNVYKPGDTLLMIENDVVFFAKWNETFTITYFGNGNENGSVPKDSNRYIKGDAVTIQGNSGDLSLTGHTFAGWDTVSRENGTAAYAESASIKIGNHSIVLYAHWTTNPTYRVFYNGNGHTGGTAPVDANNYEQDAKVTVKENTGNLTKPGFVFGGWNTDSTGTGTRYVLSDTLKMGSSNCTLYAQWNIAQHLVRFETSGGSTIDSQLVLHGSTAIAPTSLPVRPGYQFAGWYSDPTFALLFVFTTKITSPVTIYIKWIPIYTVTYDPNGATGGSVPVDSTTFKNGELVMILENTGSLVKTGYTFIGWYTNPNGTAGSVRYPGETFQIGSTNVRLYANWTVNQYTVRFNGNGNTGGSVPDTARQNYGTTMIIPGNGTLVRTGYTFAGWSTTTSWGGHLYTAGQLFTFGPADSTLYAQWTAGTHTLVFDKNDISATGSMTAQNFVFGSPARLQQNTFIKTGYRFSGWANSSGGTVAYADSALYTMTTTGDTLYAQWSANTYSLVFDKNDNSATGSMTAQNFVFGSPARLQQNTFIKTGYRFSGWAISAGGAMIYSDTSLYTMNTIGDTLFAKWQEATPVITSFLSNQTRYFKDTVTFTVVATGANLNYRWEHNGTEVPGITTASLRKDTIEFTDTGTYRCVISNSAGNVESSARLVIDTMMDVDGNVYHLVKIGEQVWTVENLLTTKYRDGKPIPLVTDNTAWSDLKTPGYCFYDNNTDHALQCKWGALYNWYTVNTGILAPAGWHVPTYEEWAELETYLIANGYNWDGTTTRNKIAKSMAATTNWSTSVNNGAIGNDLSKNNKSGFSALPGGFRYRSDPFSGVGTDGCWWSATEYDTINALPRYMNRDQSILNDGYSYKRTGFSVRLLKNNASTPNPPSTPPVITFARSQNFSITVNFTAITGATSYNLYYNYNNNRSFNKNTAVLISGVSPGATFEYWVEGPGYNIAVCAVNLGGESPLSNVYTVQTGMVDW